MLVSEKLAKADSGFCLAEMTASEKMKGIEEAEDCTTLGTRLLLQLDEVAGSSAASLRCAALLSGVLPILGAAEGIMFAKGSRS